MTPAGTSNELDVQNGWEENTHTHRVQMAKRSQAPSAGEVYVPPGHKLICDPRYGPNMYSFDIISSYIFFKTAGEGWQFAKMPGLAEDAETVMFPHTIKMLDFRKWFNVHL